MMSSHTLTAPATTAAAPRLPGAEARLQRLLAQALARPFAWGAHDCALLVADAAEALTGVDPAADLRGRYSSEGGAHRLLMRRLGLQPQPGCPARPAALLAGICQQRLAGAVPVAQALPGDAGLTSQAGRWLLAVHAGGGQWLAPAALGLAPVVPPFVAWSAACRK